MNEDRFTVAAIRATSPQPTPFQYTLDAVDDQARTINVTFREKRLTLENLPVAETAKIRAVNAGPNTVARLKDLELRALRPGMRVSITLRANANGELIVHSITTGDYQLGKELSQ
jgi:hypothetical protein